MEIEIRRKYQKSCYQKILFLQNFSYFQIAVKTEVFFIDYELDSWSRDLNADFRLNYCLFGAVKLTKNVDFDKYSYLGYSIRFNSRSLFLIQSFDFGKTVIIFGVDNNYSTNTDNRKKYILVLGEGPTQGLDDTKIIAEVKYSINIKR